MDVLNEFWKPQVPSERSLRYVSFNQDCTSLTVATSEGYRFFCIKSMENIRLMYESSTTNPPRNYHAVERYYSSPTVAHLRLQERSDRCEDGPRNLCVDNIVNNKQIFNDEYKSPIFAVRLNKRRVVTRTYDGFRIYDVRNEMKFVYDIYGLQANRKGTMALNSDGENCFLAYPCVRMRGDVVVFDVIVRKLVVRLKAHDEIVTMLAFDKLGSILATASIEGSRIRVFSMMDKTKIADFQRSAVWSATIYSMSFSPDSKFLCATSNTSTIHIYKIPEQQYSFYKKITNLLPVRSFAKISLPMAGTRTLCALTAVGDGLRVFVASSNGFLYAYDFNTEAGNCSLVKEFNFCDPTLITSTKSNSELLNLQEKEKLPELKYWYLQDVEL